jgi:hypothetical protein
MSTELVDRIAQAVLYEGYILYPYRPSIKNRQRWTFGGIYPKSYTEAHPGSDACEIQTQILILGDAAVVHLKLRFLHLTARTIAKLPTPASKFPCDAEALLHPVDCLEIDGQLHHHWQEAVEREIEMPALSVAEVASRPQRRAFYFASRHQIEPLHNSSEQFVGAFVRDQHAIRGLIEVSAEHLAADTWKLTARISNGTRLDCADTATRDDALLGSFVSAHVVLTAARGEFVSLTDPPEMYKPFAEQCSNKGVWPVLVGADGDKSTLLASPIILSDYPQIAPESPGDLFDSGEIDEILSLRILTLTDEEKRAASAVDPRGAALLQRTEALARDQLARLHGTFRGLQTVDKNQEPL